MFTLARRALLAALTALLAAAPASAKVPDPRFSRVDSVVNGNPEGSRAYRLEVKDINELGVIGRVATLDFSETSVRLYDSQEAGTTANCAARTLSRMTDMQGIATFHPRFGGGCAGSDVSVYCEGVLLDRVPARSTDIDAADGCVGLGDLVTFTRAFLDGNTGHPELDFDGSGGRLGLGDLIRFGEDFMDGTKGSYCP